LRVAAAQFKAEKGCPGASLSALSVLVEPSLAGVDLLVLPEMALTGYAFGSRDEVAAVAEPATGATFAGLSALARSTQTWVVCGYPEAGEDGRLYNSALVISATGELVHSYRKSLLFEADLGWATPGEGDYRVYDTGRGTFAVGICMDLNDPRFLAWLRGADPDVLAFPTNWVEEGLDVWPYWAARMWGSGATLVAANSYGSDGSYVFSGRSAILQATGLRVGAEASGNALLVATVPTGTDR
jgi:predicted amidohydrolase